MGRFDDKSEKNKNPSVLTPGGRAAKARGCICARQKPGVRSISDGCPLHPLPPGAMEQLKQFERDFAPIFQMFGSTLEVDSQGKIMARRTPQSQASHSTHHPGGTMSKKGLDPSQSTPNPRLLEDLPVHDLLQACRKLADLWALSSQAIAALLGTSRTTWIRWLEKAASEKEPKWTKDQRSRGVALLTVFEAVGDLHQNDQEALAWPHETLYAPGFEGKTPLQVMTSDIEGLFLVRDYLKFLLGGGL